MSTRVQVVMAEAQREAFRRQAAREGMSLSAWLLQAANERLVAHRSGRLRSVEGLDEFFAGLPDPGGDEPDWEVTKEAINRSKAAGVEVT